VFNRTKTWLVLLAKMACEYWDSEPTEFLLYHRTVLQEPSSFAGRISKHE